MKQGRKMPISAARRLIIDLLHFAQKVPTVPVQRLMKLAPLCAARRRMSEPVSWTVICVRAFARTAQSVPELRRAYIPFPRPHLYEHPISVASVAVERDHEGEKIVLFGHLRGSEEQPLGKLDEQLRRLREAPVESVGLFRRALRLGRLPRFVRRLVWWLGLNSSGRRRAKRMGTFAVSVYSALGAESLHPMSPLTATLNYGVIQPDGSVAVRIIYDHRVMDGSTVARALALMEEILVTEIKDELETGATSASTTHSLARTA